MRKNYNQIVYNEAESIHVNNSFMIPSRQNQLQNVNFAQTQLHQYKNQFDKLDQIIMKTLRRFTKEEPENEIKYESWRDQNKRPEFNWQLQQKANKFQLIGQKSYAIDHQDQSIANQTQRQVLEVQKQPYSMRFVGRLTKTYRFQDVNEIQNSEDQSCYYNFTLKDSNLNDLRYINHHHANYGPESQKILNTQRDYTTDNKNFSQTQEQKFGSGGRMSHQNQNNGKSIDRTNQNNSRVGFIRQNRFNSNSGSKNITPTKHKPTHQNNQQLSCATSSNLQSITPETQRFVLKFKQQKIKQHQLPTQQGQQILNIQKLINQRRVLDDQKSIAQSLKQTFDSSNTHIYQISSGCNQNYASKAKTQTIYFDPVQDQFYDERFSSYQSSPFEDQYESDLFQFINKELVSVTIQNKKSLETQNSVLDSFNIQKDKNLNLFNLYKKTKYQFGDLLQKQSKSFQILESQIKLLEEQLEFYRLHSNSIQQSIKTKIRKQDEFYFKHKTNLDEIIISNNQKISLLKNQLFQAENQFLSRQPQMTQQNRIQFEMNKSQTFRMAKSQNQKLRLELEEQQQLQKKTYQKYKNFQQSIHDLHCQKAKEIKSLVEEFEQAKNILSFIRSQSLAKQK